VMGGWAAKAGVSRGDEAPGHGVAVGSRTLLCRWGCGRRGLEMAASVGMRYACDDISGVHQRARVGGQSGADA
jgi:hypothetical protein